MGFLDALLSNLPEVRSPEQKKAGFKSKLKWTGIILVLYFVMNLVPLFGLGQNQLQRFEFLAIILGASFGSIFSLGIGPLVTGSIVLQLLNGAGIVKFDTKAKEGRARFSGVQKLMGFFFVVFEACIYVFMGGLAPAPELVGSSIFFVLQLMLIFQLILGGILVMFMDEVIQKYGFGSGISLFIAAGVSQEIFIRGLSPLPSPTNPTIATGALPALIQSLSAGNPTEAMLQLATIVATIVTFMVCIYFQSMKAEIPLSFGVVRGQGIRWPLNFLYTSNMPVILVAALLANVQLWGRLLQNWGYPLLGEFGPTGNPISGLVYVISSPNMFHKAITGSLAPIDGLQALLYIAVMAVGSLVFSWFWVQTSGMDAGAQAKQMLSSGLQIPGFRKDARVLEKVLQRYIGPLTVMGGLTVGALAAFADLTGALSRGTGILLAVMIIYKLYEDIARQHLMDMNPMMRKFMGRQ